MFNGKTVRTCIREREIQFNLYTFQPIAMRQRKSLLCSKDVFGRPHDGPGNFEMQVPKVQIEFKKGLREKSRPSLRLRGYQIGGVRCMRQIRTLNRYYVLSKTGSKNSFERQNLLFTPMKRSPSGWPMGQGGRVSLMSSDPVPDLSRLLRHPRRVSSGIHCGVVADGYPLTTCGYDGWSHMVHP
jgi:hypothetical protein